MTILFTFYMFTAYWPFPLDFFQEKKKSLYLAIFFLISLGYAVYIFHRCHVTYLLLIRSIAKFGGPPPPPTPLRPAPFAVVQSDVDLATWAYF